MIVALALSPSLDVTYEVAELRLGDITRPVAVTRVAGGKALNAARVARALGGDIQVVAALGGHIGDWVAEFLAADGVGVHVVRLSRETRMSLAIVEVSGRTSSTDLYETATPLSPDEWRAFGGMVRAVAVADARAPWVVASGSLPAGVPPEEVAVLLQHLRSAGARVAVDSSGAGLRAMAGQADLLKVNRMEAGDLLGGPQPDAETAARALRAVQGCDAVVTDGVRGGFAIIAATECLVEPPRTPGRFSAGSGDAFLGGLLTGLDAGLDVYAALQSGRDAAERNARVPGQGILG